MVLYGKQLVHPLPRYWWNRKILKIHRRKCFYSNFLSTIILYLAPVDLWRGGQRYRNTLYTRHAYVRACAYISIRLYACVYVWAWASLRACMNGFSFCLCACVCSCICTCVCIYACLYLCERMRTHVLACIHECSLCLCISVLPCVRTCAHV